ncbi:MAG: ABC transporter ATP-binding protein [bacterium]
MKLKLKNNSIIALFRYMWRYSKGRRHWVIIFIAFSIIGNSIWLLEPIVIGRVFNSIQFSASDPKLLSYIVKNLSWLIVILIGFWIFHGTSRLIEQLNAFFVRKNYRKDMLDKVMALPAEWHIAHHSGDTIDKIDKASENLFMFSCEFSMLISMLVAIIGSALVLLYFDWKSCLIAVAISSIIIFIIAKFDIHIKRGYDAIFKFENNLAAAIHDYIGNIITVITLKLSKRAAEEIHYREMKVLPDFKKNNILNESKWFLTGLVISVMTFSALSLNAYFSYKFTGVIMIGTVFMLYKYLQGIGQAFYNFAWKYGEILRQDTAVRAAEVITEDYSKLVENRGLPPSKGVGLFVGTASRSARLPKNWKTLKISNLSFSYKDFEAGEFKGIKHINNISLAIHNGQKIAFIGESGSGKSTVLALLRGLFKPEKVKLYCDGNVLKNGLKHIKEYVTLIPQEPEIFNTTVKDNITMGIHGNRKKLDNIMEIAQFKKVILRLPRGLNTNVMEKGVSLSGGEKQRLALARGLFAAEDSQFILLDEPTSSVDSVNERKIYENIFSKYKDKTIIGSIHRLHLLEMFDYIYYFRNGKIITEGTFITLLEDEDFKKLWNAYQREEKEE